MSTFTFDEALDFLNNNGSSLSIQEIVDLVLDTDANPVLFDNNDGNAYTPQTNVFNSGDFTNNITSVNIAERISNITDSNGNRIVGVLGDTDAVALTQNLIFRNLLDTKIGNANPSWNLQQVEIERNRILNDEIFPEVSRQYAASVSGSVIIAAPDINLNGVLAQKEIPELINNPNVTTINGVDRAIWQGRYTETFDAGKTVGLSDTDAINAAKMQVATDISVHARAEGLSGLVLDVDPNDGSLKAIGIKSDFANNINGAQPFDIINPQGEVRSVGSFMGHLDEIALTKAASLGDYFNKAGYVGTALGSYASFVSVQSKINAGDYAGAGEELSAYAGSIIGGLGGGYVFGGGASIALLMIPGVNVGIVGGMIVIGAAALAGSYVGGEFISDQSAKLYNSLIDMGVIDANEIAAFLDNFGDLSGSLLSSIADISDYVSDILDDLAIAAGLASPLVFDLDGDGVELLLMDNGVYWDVDVDGFAEQSGWVGADDGLLALDINGNGVIDNHSELFGTLDVDGFTLLSVLDSNVDGVIDVTDERFADLVIWQDVNGDGISQETEILSLSAWGITEIALNATTVDYMAAGNHITHTSTFTMNGQSHEVVDAWFAYDNTNSRYVGDVTLDPRVLFLPTLRGYGELPDLHIAMSLDNGTDGLLNMVQEFAVQGTEDLFASDIIGDVKDILYRWAGVDGVDPSSRSSYVDARALEFLEALTGEPFLQNGYLSNPYVQAGEAVMEVFEKAAQEILIRLVMQGPAKQVFSNEISYDSTTDEYTTPSTLDADVLDDLAIEAAAANDTTAFWENILYVVSVARGGAEHVTSADETALDTAIQASDPYLSYTDVHFALFGGDPTGIYVTGDGADNTLDGTIKNDTLYGYGGNDILNGDAGHDRLEGYDDDDILNGGSGSDTLYGEHGNDTLNGGEGNDTLEGGYGNDVLHGGTGADLIYGGYGDDSYVYNVGDGVDTIREYHNGELNDKIVFGAGITLTDLTFTRLGNNDLSIAVNVSSNEGEIIIENQFSTYSGSGSVEILEFSDSSIFDLLSLSYELVGRDEGETLYGVQNGGDHDDIIYAQGGDDVIYGYQGADKIHGGDGDDTIYGAERTYSTSSHSEESKLLYGDFGNDHILGSYGDDHLYGGTGNDVIEGFHGDDTYYFELGEGHDRIKESNHYLYGTTDTICLGDDIEVSDVTIIREGSYDLKILINGGYSDSITLVDQFKTGSSSGSVEYIQFHDNTIWDLTTMNFGLVATEASETLHGNNSGSGNPDDIIYGEGGDDTIYGYYGSDQLHGGNGNDSIYAGYYYSYYQITTNHLYGDAGNDTLYAAEGNDHLYGGTGDDIIYGDLGSDHYYFERGHGNDIIHDEGAATATENIDILHFGESIVESDLSYIREGNYNLTILINGGAGGSINIVNQFKAYSAAGTIEHIYLSNNNQIDLTNESYVLNGTSAGETLYGTEAASLGNDIIYGGGGNDIIHGYMGSDQLYGGDGDDVIHAGGTSNPYYSKTTVNYLYGGTGHDILYGAQGIDYIYGGSGNDRLEGRYGNDHYYFNLGDGDDIIVEQGVVSGSDNIDVLHFGEGITSNNISFARDGNWNLKILVNDGQDGSINIWDQFLTGNTGKTVDFIEFNNNTQIDLRTLSYTLTGTAASETLYGVFVNAVEDDVIYGEGGNDTIHGNWGSDELHGGDGDDTIYAGSTHGSVYNKTSTNYLYGDAGNDLILGAAGVDHIYGGLDNDVLRGNRGNDHYYFDYGDGHDQILEYYAASENNDVDTLHFGEGITLNTISFARDGNANLKILIDDGAGGSITLLEQFLSGSSRGAIEYVTFNDNSQIDLRSLNYTYIGSSSDDYMTGANTNSLQNDVMYGEEGNDTIEGLSGSDEIHGGNGNDIIHAEGYYSTKTNTNYLHGDAGNDTIHGANGVDHIYGGTGDDYLLGRQGTDQYYYSLGDGHDTIQEIKNDIDTLNFDSTVSLADLSFVRVGEYDLKITVNDGIDGSITLVDQFSSDTTNDGALDIIKFSDASEVNLITQNYTLVGTSSNDTLNGTKNNSGSNDIIYGGDGDDYISGYYGADTLYGGNGNDTIYGGGAYSPYYTETDPNILFGEAGDDTLKGSWGDDVINGGDGNDYLKGDYGADTFLFMNGETGMDTIADFTISQGDALDLSDMLSGYDPLNDLINDFVTFTTNSGNTIVAVDQDGNGSVYSAQNIATLSDITGLDADDMVNNGSLIVA